MSESSISPEALDKLRYQAGKLYGALLKFVDCINKSGGIVQQDNCPPIQYAPNADQSWVDLADVYLVACEALGREPEVNEFPTKEFTCDKCHGLGVLASVIKDEKREEMVAILEELLEDLAPNMLDDETGHWSKRIRSALGKPK